MEGLMRKILSAATAAAMLWFGAAAAQTHKKAAAAPAKKPAATAKKSTTSASAHKGTTTKKAAPKKPAVTWRNRQMAPSPDRYREIQAALVTRGYLGEQDATGVWNQASIDALKKFQMEQNIDSSGKINSLSLIALGLGPKRDAAPMVPPKPQADGQ
jgi:hypothetical protein